MKKYISAKSRMKIHIIGAGPTGMSLAWEILKSGDHDVTLYDRKLSAGGSWWEPEVEVRDLHAHRLVFDRAFVNFRSLLSEMKIDWNDIFVPVDKSEYVEFALRSLSLKDYGALVSLATRVYAQSNKYKGIPLKEAIGTLSEKGQALIEHLPLVVDGVTWDVMSAYEFVKSFDHTLMSRAYTQRVSGKVMCDAMEDALIEAGANFVFGKELMEVEYLEDGYKATLSGETQLDDGLLFLCLDNSPALKFLGDNWGPDADKKVRESTYGAINILLDYETPMTLGSDVEIAATTKWNLQPKVLSDGKTVSCVICDINEEILSKNPDELKLGVLEQLGLEQPTTMRIGWGATWEDDKWVFSQSSGVLSLHGQLPFFGKCPHVAMCGMMSPRDTPYSSLEAATEVSRRLSHQVFGTREPLHSLELSQILVFVVVLLIVLILIYRNRNQ
jgi:hypothetical protein